MKNKKGRHADTGMSPFLVYPKSVIRIRSGFLLYIERIFVRFFAGIAGYVKKKLAKRRQ